MKTLKLALAIACLVLAAGPAGAADEQGRKPPEDRWNAHDTDGDGALSRAEAEAGAPGLARNFDRIDADGDGRVTREEANSAREQMRAEARKQADERWRGADKDGDGLITREEAKAGMPRVSENFDQLDADGDGRLSRGEVQRSMQQHRQRQMQQMESGHGGGGNPGGKGPGGGKRQ
ncbi:MAG: hypothetical protein MUC71_12240 [Steroidobacteraceae bacterium]|jgi:hypothetical protein|nr:hypothetical protein [Steroidobacteraceae bacterium]